MLWREPASLPTTFHPSVVPLVYHLSHTMTTFSMNKLPGKSGQASIHTVVLYSNQLLHLAVSSVVCTSVH